MFGLLDRKNKVESKEARASKSKVKKTAGEMNDVDGWE